MAKFKVKETLESGEKEKITFRINKEEKKDLELLATIAEGFSSVQDLMEFIIKDTLKSNKKIIDNAKGIIIPSKPSILNEEEEMKKLLEEEAKTKEIIEK